MKLTFLLILLFSPAAWAQSPPIAEGPFQGNLDSLKQYDCPDWFRDAKFGIWAHWGPQAVPMIGDWYYNKNWKFRPVSWTIHMLVDIVSKNGNLLLNIVQRPDGSLDAEVEEALNEMADWIAVHGEAIYGTRPWLVYGEGDIRYKGGHFREDFSYSARDIRFTTKGPVLYAIALGWPEDGKLLVRSLATPAGKVNTVSVLGSDSKIDWQQTDEGLTVTVPLRKVSEYTCALKITGANLKPAPIPQVVITVSPDAQGDFQLVPDDADLHGDQVKTETQGGQPNIGFWDKADEWVSWNVRVDKPGKYLLSVSCATPHADAEIVAEVAGRAIAGKPARTGGWADFRVAELGQVEFTEPGVQVVSIRPLDAASWKAINLRWVRLSAKR